MPIRLIAIDMDGTLLGQDGRISPENAAAERHAMDTGIQIAICTGRTVQDVKRMTEECGLTGFWTAACNGAWQLDPMKREIAKYTFPPETGRTVIQEILPLPLILSAFLADRIAYHTPVDLSRSDPWRHLTVERNLPMYSGEEALWAAAEDGVLKFVAFDLRQDEPTEALRSATTRMEALAGVHLTSSGQNNIELIPAGADKGRALRNIAGRLGLRADEVMAIGDQHNDLPMLRWAGLSIAMGNALPEVRFCADHVTERNDRHGVALAIRRFALGRDAS